MLKLYPVYAVFRIKQEVNYFRKSDAKKCNGWHEINYASWMLGGRESDAFEIAPYSFFLILYDINTFSCNKIEMKFK